MEIRQATINAMDRLAREMRWCNSKEAHRVREIKSIIGDQDQGKVFGTAVCSVCGATISGEVLIGGRRPAKVDPCALGAPREKT